MSSERSRLSTLRLATGRYVWCSGENKGSDLQADNDVFPSYDCELFIKVDFHLKENLPEN